MTLQCVKELSYCNGLLPDIVKPLSESVLAHHQQVWFTDKWQSISDPGEIDYGNEHELLLKCKSITKEEDIMIEKDPSHHWNFYGSCGVSHVKTPPGSMFWAGHVSSTNQESRYTDGISQCSLIACPKSWWSAHVPWLCAIGIFPSAYPDSRSADETWSAMKS